LAPLIAEGGRVVRVGDLLAVRFDRYRDVRVGGHMFLIQGSCVIHGQRGVTVRMIQGLRWAIVARAFFLVASCTRCNPMDGASIQGDIKGTGQ